MWFISFSHALSYCLCSWRQILQSYRFVRFQMLRKKDMLHYTENMTIVLNRRWGIAGLAASYHCGILSLATQLRSQPQPLEPDCLKPAFQTAAIQRCCIRSDLWKLINLSRNQTKKCIFLFMRHFLISRSFPSSFFLVYL